MEKVLEKIEALNTEADGDAEVKESSALNSKRCDIIFFLIEYFDICFCV